MFDVTRDDVIQCLLATRNQSEGVAADAILQLFADQSRALRQDLVDANVERLALAEDAKRYDFIRENYCWHRKTPTELESGHALVGLKFAYEDDFQCKGMLDYNIDQRRKKAAADSDKGRL